MLNSSQGFINVMNRGQVLEANIELDKNIITVQKKVKWSNSNNVE